MFYWLLTCLVTQPEIQNDLRSVLHVLKIYIQSLLFAPIKSGCCSCRNVIIYCWHHYLSATKKNPSFPLNHVAALLAPKHRQNFCTYWPAAEWVSTFWSRGWLTCRVWQSCVGGLPGTVGRHRTCAAVSVAWWVQSWADVQVQLLSLGQRVTFKTRVRLEADRKTDLVNVAQCMLKVSHGLPSLKREQSLVETPPQSQTLASFRLALQHNWQATHKIIKHSFIQIISTYV